MRILLLFILVCLSNLTSAQKKDSVEVPTICDTSFYHVKPLFGPTEEVYPSKITCYFLDSTGAKTDRKSHLYPFKNGELHGMEKSYYYSTDTVLVNWWGRPYRKPIGKWRKKIFATEMPNFRLKYRGYWKNGKKHGEWYYYDFEGYEVSREKYENGVLVEEP